MHFKINRKIITIFFICFVFLCSIFFNIDNTFAVNNASGGGYGISNSCGSGAICYSGTSGVRVTFVKYEKGKTKRCKYKKGNICTADDSGEFVDSIDYWGNPNEFFNIDSQYCHSFKDKKIKTESLEAKIFSGEIEEKNLQFCRTYKFNDTLSNAGFNVEDYMTKDSNGNLCTRRGITIKNAIKDFSDKLDKYIESGMYKNEVEKVLNNIIIASTNNNLSLDDVSSIPNNVFIQFEQLIQITDYKGINSGTAGIGTVAEVSYLLHKTNTGFRSQCINYNNNTGFKTTPLQCGQLQTTAYEYGYWTGWYGDATKNKFGVAGNLDLEVVKKTDIPGLFLDDSDQKNISALKKNRDQDLTKFYEKNSANVMNVWVNPQVINGCDSAAKKYISSFKKNKISEAEYLKKLKEDPATTNCMNIVMHGAVPVYECDVLNPYYVKLIDGGYTKSHSSNVCTSYRCQEVADAVYSKYYATSPDQIGTKGSEYENTIDTIKNIFQAKDRKDYNSLDTEVWQMFYPSGPKCENKDIHCEVTQNVVGNCDENGIKFTDSSKKIDGKECYKAGVSYNVGSIIQGSKAQELSNGTCNVYCKETVTFNLPGSPKDLTGKDVAAGTVLKWGITSKFDSKFGEMTVTRTCHATGTGCNLNNPMNWTDKIGTKVSVYFKESTGDVTIRELQTNLSEVKFNGNLPTYTSSNLSNTSCNSFNGCKSIMNNGGDFTLSAKFTFNYGNDAHNYSDKSTADGKTVTNVSSDSKYIDIGYGFPTKFTNRPYIFNIYDSEHNKYLWGALDTMRGYLYASIKNIGTKVTGGYHFDKIIKDTSSSDDSYVVSGNEYSVRYSCPVSVVNPLWDTECFDKDGNKYPLGSSYCKDDEKPKGLDVVFRTVQLINKKVYETGNTSAIEDELNKAFPGRTGKGRYTGKDKNDNRIVGTNWLTIDIDEGNNTKRIFDILSNMVYAQKPAYHIVLNTSKINYIRKNNATYRSSDLDPYTDKKRYKFDKANASDYSYGASDFITDLISKNWLDGECASGDNDYRAKKGACRQS